MLTRKERKAIANEAKRNVKTLEDNARKQRHIDMLNGMSVKLLETFIACPRMKIPAEFPVAVRVDVPLWDCSALLADAKQLMSKFPSAIQYGGLHDGMWSTLCLRSLDGSTNNDCAASSYKESLAWSESTYIVPHLLNLLSSAACFDHNQDNDTTSPSFFQRVRLSIIPPNCNVAWHVDYENTQRDGPIRMHIPIQCSSEFTLNIELPHRLSNNSNGVTRIHLVVDMFPLPLESEGGKVVDSVLNVASAPADTSINTSSEVTASVELPVVVPIVLVPLHSDLVVTVVDVVNVVDVQPICPAEVPDVLLVDVIPCVVRLASTLVVTDVVPLEAILSLPLLEELALTPVDLTTVINLISSELLVVAVPDIAPPVPLDWAALQSSDFGRAIVKAFDSLYRDSGGDKADGSYSYNVCETIAASVAAFSEYRWGGPFANTTEARAAIEAAYYLK